MKKEKAKTEKEKYEADKEKNSKAVTKYARQRYVKPIHDTDDVIELARANTADAMYVMYSLMIDEKVQDSVRLKAAEAILNRGWGTPVRSVHVKGQVEHRAVHEMSTEELAQIIERARSQEGMDGLPSKQNNGERILDAEFVDKKH